MFTPGDSCYLELNGELKPGRVVEISSLDVVVEFEENLFPPLHAPVRLLAENLEFAVDFPAVVSGHRQNLIKPTIVFRILPIAGSDEQPALLAAG